MSETLIPTPAAQKTAGEVKVNKPSRGSKKTEEVAPVATPLETKADAEEVETEEVEHGTVAAEVAENARAVKSPSNKKLPKKPLVDKKIKVVATDKCYYNNTRITAGKKFTIRDMSEFSYNCMELIK